MPQEDFAPAPPPAPAPASEATAPGITAATPAAEPPARRLLEWLWRRRALAEVRTRAQPLPAVRQARLDRARAVVDAADRLLDLTDPSRREASPWIALGLYREAAHWALLANDDALRADTLARAWDASDPAVLAAATGKTEPAALRAVLVERPATETAELPREVLAADAQGARAFVLALIGRVLAPIREERRLLVQRCTRVSLAAALALGLIASVVMLVRRQNANLAEGKPWRTSSTLATCNPAKQLCAGARTSMFFCTTEEESPWIEIDLKASATFSSVEVTNRSDCCAERAVPLVIEVSNDRRQWREVARRNEVFSTWAASFAPQNAQYVRLRALKRTILHLDGVAVRRSGRGSSAPAASRR